MIAVLAQTLAEQTLNRTFEVLKVDSEADELLYGGALNRTFEVLKGSPIRQLLIQKSLSESHL